MIMDQVLVPIWSTDMFRLSLSIYRHWEYQSLEN